MKQTVWYARPGIILSLLALLILTTVLFTRTALNGRNGDPRLTTTSADPLGAKLFYQLAERMGYEVRREATSVVPPDSQTILAVLDPTIPIEAAEAHAILQHVRAGGALLLVLGSRTGAMSDSLDISIDATASGYVNAGNMVGQRCGGSGTLVQNGMWFGLPTLLSLKIADSVATTRRTFLTISGSPSRRGGGATALPAVIGLPYGNGRIVVASDPDVLRNDALRNCSYGLDLPMVAALRFLTDEDGVNRRQLVFDEYHQSRRPRMSSNGVVTQYLTQTRSGNFLLVVCAGGLLLLLSAAPRVLPPHDDIVVERRSPLEHVDALARAYAQVGATRTGTLRLVRGLQRRVGNARRANVSVQDDTFLARVADSMPAVHGDVSVVKNALANTVSQREFVEVGNAIARIEAALTRT